MAFARPAVDRFAEFEAAQFLIKSVVAAEVGDVAEEEQDVVDSREVGAFGKIVESGWTGDGFAIDAEDGVDPDIRLAGHVKGELSGVLMAVAMIPLIILILVGILLYSVTTRHTPRELTRRTALGPSR